MRIYIIGSDGITLCRKAPATLNDGEIAVASNEELHAAPLSAKRLLALWNALRPCCMDQPVDAVIPGPHGLIRCGRSSGVPAPACG